MTGLRLVHSRPAMDPNRLRVGDAVAESPIGPGKITGFTQVGYPQVEHIAVCWLKRSDGVVFDPNNSLGQR